MVMTDNKYVKDNTKTENSISKCNCPDSGRISNPDDEIVRMCPFCKNKAITNNKLKLMGRVIA